ncbi:MAG: FAD-binding protein [Thermodesulfobacteriota bacterium]|nr:FAD-binding protein [Thermodesulfobacteriota bacterium]
MFDLAIIGAGPAGATLARLIGKSYKVLLVDKRSFLDVPGPFSAGKCCGGLLAPDAQRMLSEFGLGLPKKVLQGPQLFVVKAIDIQQKLERYYQRHYINMDRQKFDSWLLSMVPTSVDTRTNFRFKSYSPEKGFFKLKFVQGDRTYVEKARILIGADGASSKVRLQASPGSLIPGKYIAVQEWVENDDSLPYFMSIFDREITDYYCWTIPKGDYLIIGAALQPKEKTAEKFRLLKETLRSNGFQFGKTVWREGTYMLRPMKTKHLSTGKDRIAFIGEAAGWISPSSAEGISYAFRSAHALAQALHTTPDGFEKRYRIITSRLRRNISLKIIKSHFIFNPYLRKMVMNSGLQSVKLYLPKEGI